MSKYKLINLKTKEEHLCDKVTIDGFEYYVSKTDIGINDYFEVDGQLFQCLTSQEADDLAVSNDYPKVISTNNPNIDIPKVKVVDEVDVLLEKEQQKSYKAGKGTISWYEQDKRREYYNKSQETHPFSEEDMIEFLEWVNDEGWIRNPFPSKESINGELLYSNIAFANDEKPYQEITQKELLQLWKEQKPKTV